MLLLRSLSCPADGVAMLQDGRGIFAAYRRLVGLSKR